MIPIPLNPVGVDQQDYFTITVTPGRVINGSALGLQYQIHIRGPKGAAYYINWGDGQIKQSTLLSTTRQIYTHTYATAGTYVIKMMSPRANLFIIGQMYAGFDYEAPYASLVYDCNFNWKAFPKLIQLYYAFGYCRNAIYKIPNFAPTLDSATACFYQNNNAQVVVTQLPDVLNFSQSCYYKAGSNNTKTYTLTKLPASLGHGNGNVQYMFAYSNLVASLDDFARNAPAQGWTNCTNIRNMFLGCSGVTGSRSAFLAKLPNVTNTSGAFDGTNTTA